MLLGATFMRMLTAILVGALFGIAFAAVLGIIGCSPVPLSNRRAGVGQITPVK
jgi:hypothetical protein